MSEAVRMGPSGRPCSPALPVCFQPVPAVAPFRGLVPACSCHDFTLLFLRCSSTLPEPPRRPRPCSAALSDAHRLCTLLAPRLSRQIGAEFSRSHLCHAGRSVGLLQPRGGRGLTRTECCSGQPLAHGPAGWPWASSSATTCTQCALRRLQW